MSRLIKATDVVGLPVVTLGGDDVAEVRDVVYEPSRGGLIGFTLNKRGFFSGRLKQVLTIDGVRAVGRDAIVVEDDDALTDKGGDDDSAIGAASSDRDVIGVSVITEEGVALGTVTDVVVRLGKKVEAVGYEVASADTDGQHFFIPLPDQVAVSGDALMVPSGFDEFVRDDLTGFGGAVDAYLADHAQRHPGNGKVHAGRSGKGSDEPKGSTRTKSDLYEEAKSLDLPGRSSMTKAELVTALSEHRGAR